MLIPRKLGTPWVGRAHGAVHEDGMGTVRIRCPADAPLRVRLQATKALRCSRVYTAGEHIKVPMATCGGATRTQLRTSARRAERERCSFHESWEPLGWRAHGAMHEDGQITRTLRTWFEEE